MQRLGTIWKLEEMKFREQFVKNLRKIRLSIREDMLTSNVSI